MKSRSFYEDYSLDVQRFFGLVKLMDLMQLSRAGSAASRFCILLLLNQENTQKFFPLSSAKDRMWKGKGKRRNVYVWHELMGKVLKLLNWNSCTFYYLFIDTNT